jgi:hypothetical protein
MTYDDSLVEYVSAEEGSFYKDWATLTFFFDLTAPPPPAEVGDLAVAVLTPPVGGPTGSGSLFVVHMKAKEGVSGTSPLTLGGVIVSDELGQALPVEIVEGQVVVGAKEERVVVSGKQLEGPPAASQFPPGFVPSDEFEPCEWVWVYGYGFEFCQWYQIYIQPYEECNSVSPEQPLDHALSAPLGYPPVSGPIEVHIEPDGTFGPVPLFHVPEGLECTYWEIVADKIGPGHQEGIYNPDEDGLDAIACNEPGFHIVPELLSGLLLAVGFASLGGYAWLRRRRESSR